jgi:hypothetical protein
MPGSLAQQDLRLFLAIHSPPTLSSGSAERGEMGIFIRGSDAFSWHMERDPMSRPIEATGVGTDLGARPGVFRVEFVRVVVQSAETP